jgi:hypothetical protein
MQVARCQANSEVDVALRYPASLSDPIQSDPDMRGENSVRITWPHKLMYLCMRHSPQQMLGCKATQDLCEDSHMHSPHV